MLQILPIPAFEDNYIWLIHNGQLGIVVDPGEAEPVQTALRTLKIDLVGILVTHHHSDHIGGIGTLYAAFPDCRVYAPHCKHPNQRYPFPHQSVMEGDTVTFEEIGGWFQVMHTPGHTLDHVVYYCVEHKALFCGDTLFSAGCGRLFEGTAEQLYQSLQRLARLPEETLVYCTHEYTLHNLEFAMHLNPSNRKLSERALEVRILRQMGQPSLPSTIGIELETNPFLRCHTEAIQQASSTQSTDPIKVFSAIRQLRNHY